MMSPTSTAIVAVDPTVRPLRRQPAELPLIIGSGLITRALFCMIDAFAVIPSVQPAGHAVPFCANVSTSTGDAHSHDVSESALATSLPAVCASRARSDL